MTGPQTRSLEGARALAELGALGGWASLGPVEGELGEQTLGVHSLPSPPLPGQMEADLTRQETHAICHIGKASRGK